MNDIIETNFNENVEAFISNCISCCECLDVCPNVAFSAIKEIPYSDIIIEMKAAITENKMSKIATQRALSCSRCGACDDVCPEDINIFEIVQALRIKSFHQSAEKPKLTKIKANGKIIDDWDIDDIVSCLQVKTKDKPWKDINNSEIKQSDTVLYLGCHSRRYVYLIQTILDIFKLMKVEVTVVAGGDICCGARLLGIGDIEAADRQCAELVDYLSKYNPKEVLVQCPMCFYRIKKQIALHGDFAFRVKHIFETIENGLNKIDFTHNIRKKVTFHDPCKLGRMSGSYQPIRNIFMKLPGLQFVEMQRAKENSVCCGGAVWRSDSDTAAALRQKVMQMAEDSGAEVLATACQFCQHIFSGASHEYNYEIVEAIQIIGYGLGIFNENKLSRYCSYHDPERVISECQDNIIDSPYTEDEVRQVLKLVMPEYR